MSSSELRQIANTIDAVMIIPHMLQVHTSSMTKLGSSGADFANSFTDFVS